MRRRAVVLRGFVYFVGTHTRSTVPLGRSAAALGAIIEGSQILVTLNVTSMGKGLKSSLAFRKPATAVASRRPGRADGLMVGLDGHASLSAGRAPWRDWQAFLDPTSAPEHAPEARRQSLSSTQAERCCTARAESRRPAAA